MQEICRCFFRTAAKCRLLSEEVKSELIIRRCLPILAYGVDILQLSSVQIHKLSVAFNCIFRRIFHLARNTSVRNILHYMGTNSLPFTFDQRRVLLVKDCLSSNMSLLQICASIAYNDEGFVRKCYTYDVHPNMSSLGIKRNFGAAFIASMT